MNNNNLISDNFNLLDFVPLGIFIINSDYNILFWNKTIEEWTGIENKSVLNQNLFDIFDHFGKEKYKIRLDLLFNGGPTVIFSSQRHGRIINSPLPDGSFRIHHTTVTNISGPDNKHNYALFSIEDVTALTKKNNEYRKIRDQAVKDLEKRKTIEENLKQSSKILKIILDSSPIGIGLVLNNKIDWVNEAILKIFGFSDENSLKGKDDNFFYISLNESALS